MFFGGALQTLATILWWLTDLYTRFVLGQPVAWTVAPGAAHAYLMIYGLFPFFIFGFLMTVFPRWMAGKEISASRYTPAFVLLMLGAILFYIGLASNKIVLAASILLTLCGWAIACYALLRVLLDTAQQNKRHPIAAVIALTLGWCGILSYLVWLLGGQGMWLNFALQAGAWLLLLPVFATVGHRMIPFFTSGALLQNNTISRAEWPWWVILARRAVCNCRYGLAGLLSAMGDRLPAHLPETALGRPPRLSPTRKHHLQIHSKNTNPSHLVHFSIG
jgi:uncharacterized protein involved in response to NO